VYQTPISIGDGAERIAQRRLLLPAIQRELVWKPDQITTLWDSLLRGYPIGSFLFWRIPTSLHGDVRLYDFISDYDVRSPHNVEVRLPEGADVIAVLDGQQRLSAFYIGLTGSYRDKLPRKRWSNPEAFPRRVLHLRLDEAPEEAAAADDPAFEFRFLTDEELHILGDRKELWFPVPAAANMKPGGLDGCRWLQGRGYADREDAMERLHRLLQAIHSEKVISHYEETSASIDHVLNIFIRVNSAGTQLAFSDLLLSLATAEWQTLDARREVARLQDEMNAIGQGFGFGRDRILKAALVLGDFENIKFRAENFRSRNMVAIEELWPDIRKYLLLATELVASFGLSQQTLTAENALIPVAYYLKAHGVNERYLTSDADREDRMTIRRWLFSTLLRGGYWTGAVDPVLTEFRNSVRAMGAQSFPVADFEERVRRKSAKATWFSEEEIEDLLDVTYGDRLAFLVLNLVFPEIDISGGYHIDHLHPRSAFYARMAARRGVPTELAAEQKDRAKGWPIFSCFEASRIRRSLLSHSKTGWTDLATSSGSRD
jgi:hypothetical protein